MAADQPKTTVEDYFAESPNRAQLDRAALIVALVQGRESPTRFDYAHPKIKEIMRILDEAGSGSGAKPRR